MACQACKTACELMRAHLLDARIVRVNAGGTIVEVVVWSDAIHASCEAIDVERARDEGAITFDWTNDGSGGK